MILGVFSIYDQAVKAFAQPFFSPTKGSAIRAFGDAVRDEKGPFGRHRADYILFFLGEFDDVSGSFRSPAAPEKILLAVEVELDPDPRLPSSMK